MKLVAVVLGRKFYQGTWLIPCVCGVSVYLARTNALALVFFTLLLAFMDAYLLVRCYMSRKGDVNKGA
jgi:hypothetical protein